MSWPYFFEKIYVQLMDVPCKWRLPTASFAEQNGYGAKLSVQPAEQRSYFAYSDFDLPS